MQRELIIANFRKYSKTLEDKKAWHAFIIDGLIIGLGVIEGIFVSADKVKTNLEIGCQYSVTLIHVAKKGKLFTEIDEINVPLSEYN